MSRQRRRRLQLFRAAVFIVMGAFFLIPIASMFEFSTRGNSLTAARSLGAGWVTVMLRVVVPNMSTAILNASLLAVALVLGEFTFANLLAYENLQVAINYVGLVDAGTSIAVAVASLVFAFALLMILSYFGRRQAPLAKAEEADFQLSQTVGLSGGLIGRAR